VSTQSADLRIGEVGVAAFSVAAVAKSHELDAKINTGGLTNLRYLMPKVVRLPREVYFSASVDTVACDDQSDTFGCCIETLHQLRPKSRAVFIKQRHIHEFTRLVVKNSRDARIVRWTIVALGQSCKDILLTLQPVIRNHGCRAD
jgi:hypothetical protein